MRAVEADLHAHTTASDGSEAPAAVVARARAAGLAVLAITDHDSVSGVAEAVAAARDRGGPAIVAGVELSSRLRSGDVHVLGFFVPYDDPRFWECLAERQAGRVAAARESVRRLQALGVRITFEDVEREAGGGVVGRPHIARAMVRAGAVKTIEEAFTPRFIGSGGAAHVPTRPEPPEAAVRVLREFGAAPAVAHPGAFAPGDSLVEADLAALVRAGLVGLEVFHPAHDQGLRTYYGGIAARLGLVATGGSDWHGPRAGRAEREGVEPGREGVSRDTVLALAARVGRAWP